MKQLTITLTMLWLFFVITAANATVLYVDATVAIPGNGLSWSKAFNDLQPALDEAAVLGGSVEIWVARGTYYPSVALDPGDVRTSTFHITRDDLSIYGGFVSGDVFSARNPRINRTILSGDIGTPLYRADNCYSVVTITDVDATGVLDGFRILNGEASGTTSTPMFAGGGIYIDGGSPTIANCVFARNYGIGDGGGIYSDESSAGLTRCLFVMNAADGCGGGLYSYKSDMELEKCIFRGNAAGYGGGMSAWGSNLVLNRIVFKRNIADTGGGFCSWTSTDIALTQSTFVENSSTYTGGGIHATGEDVSATNCKFIRNSTGSTGGGFYGSNVHLTNCLFFDNEVTLSSGLAGALFCATTYYGEVDVTNCTFANNSAGDLGGGIFFQDYSSGLAGGIITNCIFRKNEVSSGWDQIYDDDGTLEVNYTCIQGGWSGLGGVGNISAAPVFVDRMAGDLHLQPSSPCIDAGDDSAVPSDVVEDLDGNDRFNGTVDMGAYEYW